MLYNVVVLVDISYSPCFQRIYLHVDKLKTLQYVRASQKVSSHVI